jgi:hypothetical protein
MLHLAGLEARLLLEPSSLVIKVLSDDFF